MKKSFAALALLALAGALPAAEKPEEPQQAMKLEAGAACYVWDENVKVKPSAPPAGGFVDLNDKAFAISNLSQSSHLSSLQRRHLFIVWSGYLKIAKPGRYRLTATREDFDNSIRVAVHQRVCIELKPDERKASASASLRLSSGMHPIVIQANLLDRFRSSSFIMNYALETSVNSKVLAPATLFHQAEEE